MSPAFSAALALALRPLGGLFWLDSAGGPASVARASFLGAGPVERLEAYGRRLRWWSAARGWREELGDPFSALETLWGRARALAPPGPLPRPVCVGYLAYDLGAESLGISLPRREDAPDLVFSSYPAVYRLDHARGALLPTPQSLGALSRLGDPRVLDRLDALSRALPALPGAEAALLGYDASEDEHRAMLLRAREHLLDGDIYQANLSVGLRASLRGDPLSLYDRLRQKARAPFCAYLEDQQGSLLSASMERFLSARVDGDLWQVETRPIKGTRPRGASPADDEAQRAALLRSQKDRAEHVMIVDLERNDLGRVAQIGSVRVESLAAAISYETVHHLESVVCAAVPRTIGLAGLLRATFPTGSITGAPKRRAMQIIAALEGKPRGLYCGSIGYLDDHGGFDFSVAIRTAEARSGSLFLPGWRRHRY